VHVKRVMSTVLAAAAVAVGAAVPAWAAPATGAHARPAVASASTSPFAPGTGQLAADFIAAANDAALSRIWAGQHTPIDNQAGQNLGSRIGAYVLANFDALRSARVHHGRS